jgi:hypothetical protein
MVQKCELSARRSIGVLFVWASENEHAERTCLNGHVCPLREDAVVFGAQFGKNCANAEKPDSAERH